MEKVQVKVCLGSSCFVKGGTILTALKEVAEKEYEGQIEVNSSPCLGLCSIKCAEAKAPYVKVNDDIVEAATVEKVLTAIKTKIK